VIIGANNAGKSTSVEALRIVSWAVERYRLANYEPVPPSHQRFTAQGKWFRISQELLGKSNRGLFHHYADPPGIIEAVFSTKDKVIVYLLDENRIYCQVQDAEGRTLSSKAHAKDLVLPRIQTLPQVAPVLSQETILREERVRKYLSSPLAPHHFRNQVYLLKEFWEPFVRFCADTWPGLKIDAIDAPAFDDPEGTIDLHIRDRDFVGELAVMGHGLQMWLQIAWFLSRVPADSPIVLDEPDVYLHADLQRRLFKNLLERSGQVIVATHSTEILCEARPKDVLIIDRRNTKSRFSVSSPELQEIIDRLGGIQNLQMARLWHQRKCLIVEGDDVDILAPLHHVMFPRSANSFRTIPRLKLDGGTNWAQAVGVSKILNSGLEQGSNGNIAIYCLIDRDYKFEDEIAKLQSEAKENCIQLHIWKRHEIENYLIQPSTIARLVTNGKKKSRIDEAGVEAMLMDITASLKDEVLDRLSNHHHSLHKKESIRLSNSYARDIIQSHWGSLENPMVIFPGKEIISGLNSKLQETFQIHLSAIELARNMLLNEIPMEVRELLKAIEEHHSFT